MIIPRPPDLERKISVRSSREDLIKRGVLKEVDENGHPIVYREPITEEDDTNATNGRIRNYL